MGSHKNFSGLFSYYTDPIKNGVKSTVRPVSKTIVALSLAYLASNYFEDRSNLKDASKAAEVSWLSSYIPSGLSITPPR